MTRYHPVIAALHWIVAIMILMALVIGGPMLADMPNSNPDKLGGLAGHMIFGLSIGVLMLVRLVTRLRTRNPDHADSGNAALNLGGRFAHLGLYLFAFLMVGSGLGIALSAGLFDIVYGGSGEALPETLTIHPPRIAHGLIAKLLLALIALHVLGWAYHQFVLKDGLLRRMWFGNRNQ